MPHPKSRRQYLVFWFTVWGICTCSSSVHNSFVDFSCVQCSALEARGATISSDRRAAQALQVTALTDLIGGWATPPHWHTSVTAEKGGAELCAQRDQHVRPSVRRRPRTTQQVGLSNRSGQLAASTIWVESRWRREACYSQRSSELTSVGLGQSQWLKFQNKIWYFRSPRTHLAWKFQFFLFLNLVKVYSKSFKIHQIFKKNRLKKQNFGDFGSL